MEYLEFITQIFVRILTKHYLNNGNKRLALIVLLSLFDFFEFKINKTFFDKENLYIKCKEFTKILENKDCSDNNYSEIIEIRKFISNLIK